MNMKTPVSVAFRLLVSSIAISALFCGVAPTAAQQSGPPPTVVLFDNVRIFDGKNGQLSEPSHVLVAMGVPRQSVFGALRVTFGHANTQSDVDVLLEVIPPLVAAARPVPEVARV